MNKDGKDEQIVALKRKNKEYEEQLRVLGKQNEEFKKNEAASEQKIKALNEMQA